jgi:hypothetical protein
MTHEEIITALASLATGAEWTLTGDDLDSLVWLSEGKAPTLTQIKAEIASLPSKQSAKIVARAALLEKIGISEDEARLLLG